MNVFTLNSGSSSIKFSVVNTGTGHKALSGTLEGIGESQGELRISDTFRQQYYDRKLIVANHKEALNAIFSDIQDLAAFTAVGHRVVHGGEEFHATVKVDSKILHSLRKLNSLAPLHNPVSLLGIEMMMSQFPNLPHVAVFDTAFHNTLPEYAYRYPVPEILFQRYGIRRYGFHGISHQHVSHEVARLMDVPLEQLRLISLHLGNGASAAAISKGRSIDTSMGMTPLEGLMMGTRPGDIDSGILLHLLEQRVTPDALENLLNNECGLYGMCGENDMRQVESMARSGDRAARMAIDLFCYRVRKYIGSYMAVLGRLDAIAFTAGIGEHSPAIRQQILLGLSELGIQLDADKNRQDIEGARSVEKEGAKIRLFVVPANEELEIALEVKKLLQK
ncbi:MAG: acetate kinase [Chromatiales bacterium]|jgi:acetate kinase